MAQTPTRTESKLRPDLERALPHLDLDPQGKVLLEKCRTTQEALGALEQAGLLIEATRLVAHTLPAREAVWWACACSRHTATSGTDPALESKVREAAEEWVRRQTDEQRRTAMKEAEAAGFGSPEAWAGVAAFWSGDSMSPIEAPKVPPEPHFTGQAVAGAIALAAVRGEATRREDRLKRFLVSAKDIATGGAGRIETETD